MLDVGDDLAGRGFFCLLHVREVHVAQLFHKFVHCFLQVDLALGVVQPKDVELFGKVVKDDVDVARDKAALRNAKLVKLVFQANGVAALDKLVAKVSDSACGERNVFYRAFVLAGQVNERVKNVGLFCLAHSVFAYDAFRVKGQAAAVNQKGNALLVLHNFKGFFGHYY